MLRGLLLLLLALAAAFFALPFVMTSRALNEHGVPLPGAVRHKSEYVKVVYSGWELSRDVTIQYTVPETGSAAFFAVHPGPAQYDALRVSQPVELRYLPRRDVPAVPGANVLWQLHALPTVRLMNVQNVSPLDALLTPPVVLSCIILAGIIALLILWRITHWRPLAWAAGLGVLPLAAFILLQGFPSPTPAPSADVRHASGRVVNIGRIDKLFSAAHSRGLIADQPVDVVSLEFIPEGKAEPVVAVDLIDSGSVPGLKEQSAVTVNYEAASPRTAYLEGATRRFSGRNFSGAIVAALLNLLVMAVVLGAAYWFGRGYQRLVRSR